MFKRFISYYKPYLKTFALDMSCALGNSAVAVLYPILTRYMLNDLIPNRKFNLILIFGGVLLVACAEDADEVFGRLLRSHGRYPYAGRYA